LPNGPKPVLSDDKKPEDLKPDPNDSEDEVVDRVYSTIYKKIKYLERMLARFNYEIDNHLNHNTATTE
jgi:hypothetical protein